MWFPLRPLLTLFMSEQQYLLYIFKINYACLFSAYILNTPHSKIFTHLPDDHFLLEGLSICYMAYTCNDIVSFLSKTAHLISTKFYINVPWVNLYQIPSRNFYPMGENMGFYGNLIIIASGALLAS